jgi:hypothetical protein
MCANARTKQVTMDANGAANFDPQNSNYKYFDKKHIIFEALP